LWSVAIALLGWSVGEAAEQMLGHLKRYERAIGAAIVATGVGLWIWHFARRRRT
jgi:membrane protein DedA with SNARE-associated domain